MSTKNVAKNQTVETDPHSFADVIDGTENWEEEKIGFPPYWNPTVGARIVCKPLALDTRDETFHRWVLQATKHDIMCQEGPADEKTPVPVSVGGLFTMSAYAALPLDLFLGLEVMIIVERTRKLDGNEASKGVKRDMWVFKTLVSPESKKILAERRSKAAAQLESGNSQIVKEPF